MTWHIYVTWFRHLLLWHNFLLRIVYFDPDSVMYNTHSWDTQLSKHLHNENVHDTMGHCENVPPLTLCWSTFIHELLRTGSALVIQIFSGYMSAFELATLWLQAMLMHDVSAFLGVWSRGNCLYLMEILCNFWSVLFWKICHEYWLFLSKKCYSFLLTVVLL